MKIQIQLRDLKLTKAQIAKVERRLALLLARYGDRIDTLKVRCAGGELPRVEIDVRMKARLVRTEHADADVFVALDHAAERVARSVGRAIEQEGLWERGAK